MNLADRIRKIRESRGATQKEMAALLGISFRAWQGYELGKNIPGDNVIKKLVEMGFNANWLLTGEGAMNIEPRTLPELISKVSRLMNEILEGKR